MGILRKTKSVVGSALAAPYTIGQKRRGGMADRARKASVYLRETKKASTSPKTDVGRKRLDAMGRVYEVKKTLRRKK